uniref:Cullin N-terminal domain-containing protein n=1 Tax=Brassica oleracea var. oleracea TaxID=109376 RepID=A0A0D3B1L2_BRAOL
MTLNIPNDVVKLESAMVNPPSSISDDDDPPNISPTPLVFNLNLCRTKPDPKVLLDKAWKLLEPALKSILHEEDTDHFSFAEINNAVGKTWWNKSGEALSNLILEQRVDEEKKKCGSLPLLFIFRDELLQVLSTGNSWGFMLMPFLKRFFPPPFLFMWGFEKLMDERPWEALRMMYDLFCQADLVCHINNALSSYICQTGEKILKEEGSSLTEFKAHVDKICFTYFSEDPLLEKTAQKCFEGLGMSVVLPMLDDPFPEEMLELGSSVPLPTSHWLPRLNLGHVAFGCFFTLTIRDYELFSPSSGRAYSARGHDRLSPSIDEIAVCYLFFLPTLPIPPIGNQETANESDLAPPPIRCSISDGEETDTDHDAEYPNDVVNLESAMVNPPPNISPALTSDPKVYLDDAWKFLKPALTSILDEEDTDHFSFAKIYQVSSCCFENKVGEALFKLIVEECGAYISTTLESLAVHCNDDDDDPSLLLLPLEKFWLEYGEKFKLICSIGGVLDILTDLSFSRLGKSVNLSLLKNLMLMLNGSVSRELRFLEKPFLDSTAEFYAAEAKQVLEQSSDLPRYLKHVDVPFLLFPTYQRVGEEKKKCKSLPLFSRLQDELLEVVNRELLGVHACAILEKGFEKLMDDRNFEEGAVCFTICHVHPNDSFENTFLRFWRENTFCGFGGKTRFAVLAGKHVLRFWRENTFCGFGGKTRFAVLAGKHVLRFWRENTFCGFGGKTRFAVLAGKHVLRFWRENTFCGFGGKTRFAVLAGKHVLRFWRENTFCGFGGKTRFAVLAGKHVLRFWRENTFCDGETNRPELSRMYDLFSQADLVGHINDALSSYICKTGEKILKEEASSLAEFKARVDKICFRYFHDDPLLEKTVQTCFEGLGMSFVPTEEMLELGSSGPFPTSHWCF